MRKHICLWLLCLMVVMRMNAQMEIRFSGLSDVKSRTLADGSTMLMLPVDADLNRLVSYGMEVAVDGEVVDPESVRPNPLTTFVTDGEIETFVYDGRAYSFVFTAGEYFTAIVMSDPHIEHTGHDATTVTAMQNYVGRMIDMGHDDGLQFRFSAIPSYIPTADLVLCLGDMDKDSASESEVQNFKTAFNELNEAGIPFITLLGNHDWVPDYWGGGDYGLTTGSGGVKCNATALAVVEEQWRKAAEIGGFTVDTITDGTDHNQARPFSFSYKGVRFYCGQTYWFQKPYSGYFLALGSMLLSSATYYTPDGVIDALQAYVSEYAEEPSVWMQHYPFVAGGSDCDRWWIDTNENGATILPEDFENSRYKTAAEKKDALAALMAQTKNPVHFSGHTHEYAVNTYGGIKDYTVAAPGRHAGAAYLVLCKSGTGVVEVKQVAF
ncbi:MAG: metallophosphoesterase [Clostridium sp.]|nr:metallophosphoesterase [Clostridium sp.]